MTAVIVNEGRIVLMNQVYKQSDPDWQNNLDLGLFINSSGLSQTSVIGDLNEPTGGGYGKKNILGNSWTVSGNGECTRADEVFTPNASGYPEPIYGWFLAWSGGAAPRLLAYEIDPAGPHNMPDDNYNYTIRFSQSNGLRFNNSPFLCDEAEEMIAYLALTGTHADRGTSLLLKAYTNSGALNNTVVAGDLTTPSDGSYADAPIADASWTVDAAGRGTYAQQVFTPDGGSWNESVYGYALETVGGVGTRLINLREDPNQPINNEYSVDLDIGPQ